MGALYLVVAGFCGLLLFALGLEYFSLKAKARNKLLRPLTETRNWNVDPHAFPAFKLERDSSGEILR